jgi:hypothetical protein
MYADDIILLSKSAKGLQEKNTAPPVSHCHELYKDKTPALP